MYLSRKAERNKDTDVDFLDSARLVATDGHSTSYNRLMNEEQRAVDLKVASLSRIILPPMRRMALERGTNSSRTSTTGCTPLLISCCVLTILISKTWGGVVGFPIQ
jgi:hypothetical protein